MCLDKSSTMTNVAVIKMNEEVEQASIFWLVFQHFHITLTMSMIQRLLRKLRMVLVNQHEAFVDSE